MQAALSWIWTRSAVSVFFNDKHYTTSTSIEYINVSKSEVQKVFSCKNVMYSAYDFERDLATVCDCDRRFNG